VEYEPVRRCDLHGPYTPEDAALIVLGQLRPSVTGYLCPDCQAAVSAAAKALADAIDARALEACIRAYQA
jgi:hypothetical protein